MKFGYLRAYGWIGLVILIATLLLTIFDRHFDKGFPKRWQDGLAESFYAVMSIATSGKSLARKNLFGWVGRYGREYGSSAASLCWPMSPLR